MQSGENKQKEIKKPKYHSKTAFALFYNQAIHNIEKVLEEVTNAKIQTAINGAKEITVTVIKNLDNEALKKLENKYFTFLRIDKNSAFFDKRINSNLPEEEQTNEIAQIKKNIFLNLFLRINNFRNYYSHLYHEKRNAENEEIFAIHEDSEAIILKGFLIHLFEESKRFLETSYAKEEIEHLDLKDKNYTFFNYNEKQKKYYFDSDAKKKNNKSTVFLVNLFLTKDRANSLIDQIYGFKATSQNKEKATRECFTHFCMVKNSLFKTEHNDVRYFIDAFTHLSKVPRIALDNYKNDTLNISITHVALEQTKSIIFQQENPNVKYEKTDKNYLNAKKLQDEFEKLSRLKGISFKNIKELKASIDEIIKDVSVPLVGEEKYENYKDILINSLLNDENVRTSRDRFPEFALQFIDDFKLFKNIKFCVISGRGYEIQKQKQYHNDTIFDSTISKPDKIYSRINEIEQSILPKEEIDLAPFYKCKDVQNVKILDNILQPKYFIKSNTVFFEVVLPDKTKQKASMSIHELRNLVFVLMEYKETIDIENEIVKYILKYKELLNSILNGTSPAEIYAQYFPSKTEIPVDSIDLIKLPDYIEKYLKQEVATIDDFKKDIFSKLRYVKESASKMKGQVKNMKKYEKIREVIKYVNMFNAERRSNNRKGYLNINQHQTLEKMLGNYPNSEPELINYLKENSITTLHKDFKILVENKHTLDSILYKILTATLEWSVREINRITKRKDIPLTQLKEIAQIINVTEKKYTDTRIRENIQKFLAENIIIPRGFIKNKVSKNNSLSEHIDNKVTTEEACYYHDKIEDLFIEWNSIPPELFNTADYHEKKKQAKSLFNEGKKLKEQMMKDKVLFLMAKKYLNEKIVPNSTATGIRIISDCRYILQDYRTENETIEKELKIEKTFERSNFKINIKFGIKEFDKILIVLNDKRLEKICRNYLKLKSGETIHYIDREKYKPENKSSKKLWDIQTVMKKIDEEQLQITDILLHLEEQELFKQLSEKASKIGIAPKYVERFIVRSTIEQPLDKNE